MEIQQRVVHGRIVKVEEDVLHKDVWVTVEYSDQSRNLLNSVYTGCNSVRVPVSEKISESCAWGGCILYNTKDVKFNSNAQLPLSAKLSHVPFHITWITPDFRREYMIRRADTRLPGLEMNVGPFRLNFEVKNSTIANAGNGVFVRCQHLLKANSQESHTIFRLLPGQLLDLGIYAPFRARDKKHDHIFLLKNFVHMFKCEEYCFDTPGDGNEYMYDITDDFSGKLHEEASRHVPAYVNEIVDVQNIATVHARHDCEGSLHYLLGHAEEAHGDFKLLPDGLEREIFVDYGDGYENVRLRKGFSRLPQAEAAKRLENLETEELEYLQEIETFNAEELSSSIAFFHSLLTTGSEGTGARQFEDYFFERSLILAVLLKKRSRDLADEFADMEGDDESFCDNGVTDVDLLKMVDEAGRLINRLFCLYRSDQCLMDRVLSAEAFRDVLENALDTADLRNLSSRDFRELLDEM